MSKPDPLIHATDDTLRDLLGGDKPLVLYLHNGEAAAKSVSDAARKAAKKHQDELVFASVNLSENPTTAAKYKDYPAPAVVTLEKKLFGVRVKSAAGEIRPGDLRDHVAFLLGTGDDPAEIAARKAAKEAATGNSGTRSASDKTFKRDVLKSKVPVLVDFWAPWCGPCRQVSPTLEQLGSDYKGKVRVVKVNVDDNPALSRKYKIMSIPTIMMFKNGEMVQKTQGAQPRSTFEKMIQNALAD